MRTPRRRSRIGLLAWLVTAWAWVAVSCSFSPGPAPTGPPSPGSSAPAGGSPAAPAAPARTAAQEVSAPSGAGAAAPRRAEVLVFVASETSNQVFVFRGREPDLKLYQRVDVGEFPHNLGLSPDGRWVVTGNRRSGDVSVVDTRTLQEAARVRLDPRPHDVVFSPDGSLLAVTHETKPVLSLIDPSRWARVAAVTTRYPQHDIVFSPDGRLIYATVNRAPWPQVKERLMVIDVAARRQVGQVATGRNAHDVFLSPDGSQLWVTNSGILDQPDRWISVLDRARLQPVGEVDTGPEGYPFHAPKRGRDARYLPPDAAVLWVSDHGRGGIVGVDVQRRQILSFVPTGRRPFHVAPSPGGLLYVANNESHTVAVVDPQQRRVLATLEVPSPHGVAVLEAGP